MGDTSTRSSPSSVVYGRVGHFAQAHHMALKGLLIGGVPYRFPGLNFAFLEAGVAWVGWSPARTTPTSGASQMEANALRDIPEEQVRYHHCVAQALVEGVALASKDLWGG